MKSAITDRNRDNASETRSKRSTSVIVAKILIAVTISAMSGACATAPRYRVAGPECLEYAIASCRAAIVEDGLEAGLIHYIPTWGDGTAHAVIWVKEKDGVERIYDPAHKMYRKISPDAVILHRGHGLDMGIYAQLLAGDFGKNRMVASNARTTSPVIAQ